MDAKSTTRPRHEARPETNPPGLESDRPEAGRQIEIRRKRCPRRLFRRRSRLLRFGRL